MAARRPPGLCGRRWRCPFAGRPPFALLWASRSAASLVVVLSLLALSCRVYFRKVDSFLVIFHFLFCCGTITPLFFSSFVLVLFVVAFVDVGVIVYFVFIIFVIVIA